MSTPPGLAARRARTLHLASVALIVAIFIAAAEAPAGVAIGMLYVGVILLGLWSPWRAYPFVVAGTASLLVVIDAVAGRSLPVPAPEYVNRPLMIAVFAITAVIVRRFVDLEQRAATQLDQLADIKRALDAAAIVAITDVRGRITYVNDKFVEISGYSPEELLGQDHRIINSGWHPPEFIRDLWRTIARGDVWHGEIRNRAKDGHFYWVDTTIVPFMKEDGRPYQYIAIRADITARKAAEETLAQQAALARVGQMAAVLAHEVRNPLAGIRGAMQVLMGRRKGDDPERAVMQEIVARTESLNDLINDLLLFARPRPPRLADVDLAAISREAIGAVRQDPAATGLDFDVQGPALHAEVDADLMRATVLNLVLNAAQALHGRHGRITVSLSQAAGGQVQLEVRDTGPGIPSTIRDQIFEPFFTTKARGGGLGLPIAQRTAEVHGGSIAVRCPPEGGTVFTLTLPTGATDNARG